jgi:hypothetical protein
MRSVYKNSVANLKGKRQLREDLVEDKRIALKLILMKWGIWGCGQNSSDSREDRMAGSCKHGNVLSGSVKYEKFLTI